MAEVTGSRAAVAKLVALALLLGGAAIVVWLTPVGDLLSREGVARIVAFFRGSAWAPVMFVALYALATALAMPGSVLTLAGGALFGVFWGTVYNTIAANIGANLAFGVGRLLGRDGVRKLAGKRLDALDRATASYGFKGLLTLRLIPVVPFNALNFGSGLTAMSWPTYALATLIGIFPGTLVYTAFADALLAGSQEASREAFIRLLVAGGALVALSFLPPILKRLGVRAPGGSAALLLVAALAVAPRGVPAQVQPDTGVSAPVESLTDHAAFTEVLARVVHPPRVDYASLKAERDGLDGYLETLAETDPEALGSAGEDARLAFWINAYNACMLRQVIDHYPIKKKKGGLFSRLKSAVVSRPDNSVWQISDVFSGDFCEVAGRERSLDEIEHEIIRPMGEPRIHFAVNCAARSCPQLWPEAYTAERVRAQLDRAVRTFVDTPAHFSLAAAAEDPELRLNKVLDWFGEDFGGKDGLRTFFAPYVREDQATLLLDPDTDIEFFDYDWTLNDVER